MGGLGAPLETYPGEMKAGVELVKLPFLVSFPTALYLEGQALLTPQGALGGPGRKLAGDQGGCIPECLVSGVGPGQARVRAPDESGHHWATGLHDLTNTCGALKHS